MGDTKREQIQDWLQIIGLLGVIASLVFVGFEIKQSRDIAKAQMYQHRTELDMQMRTDRFPPEQVYLAFDKRWAGLPTTQNEDLAIRMSYMKNLLYWECNHQLYKMGLLDQEHWEVSLRVIENRAQIPEFVDTWERFQEGFRDSFIEAIEPSILAGKKAAEESE
jgi:hypothetical protein